MKLKIKLLLTTSVFLILLATSVTSAYAVIPQLIGPLQALAGVFPVILAGLVAAITTIFFTWKMWLSRLGGKVANKKVLFALIAIVVVGVSVGMYFAVLRPAVIAKPSPVKSDKKVVDSWIAFRGNLARTGNVDKILGPKTRKLLWAFSDKDVKVADFSSSPVIVGDKLYVGSSEASVFSSRGIVYCINAKTGERIWRATTGKQIFSSPSIYNGKVYIGEGYHEDYNCKLYCLDAETGGEIWSHQTTSHVESSPYITDGKVYFGAGADGVFCLDANTGEVLWHYENVHVDSSPAVWQGGVYFGTGYGTYAVYCLNAESNSESGEEFWKEEVNYPAWGSPSIAAGKVYFGTGTGRFVEEEVEPKGQVICFDARSGKKIWSFDTEDTVITAVVISEKRESKQAKKRETKAQLFFGSRDGYFYSLIHPLEADSYEFAWKKQIGSPILSSPAVTGNMVYFGANDGNIYCLDTSNGKIKWKYDATQEAGEVWILSSPAIADGKLYVGATRRHLFCIGE